MSRFWHDSFQESRQYLPCKNYPRLWHESCQYITCKNYPKFWYDSCQHSDMILVKNLVSILFAKFTQDYDIILVKIVTWFLSTLCHCLSCKNYPRFWHETCQYLGWKYYPRFWYNFCQDCYMILVKNLVSILLARITHDSGMIPVSILLAGISQDCDIILVKILTLFLSRILSVSYLQELPKILM